jgi:hypothetical protein
MVGLQHLSPQPDSNSFDEWSTHTNNGIEDHTEKGLNSIIILGAWFICNHHNHCVFDGILPNLNGVPVLGKDELYLWSLARARGISNLLALEPASSFSGLGQAFDMLKFSQRERERGCMGFLNPHFSS